MSRADVLVDADWVESHLDDPKVVSSRSTRTCPPTTNGHIKNAVRLDWTTELQQPEARDLIDQEAFSQLLSAKGISNDDTVVLYGGNNNWFAAYAYWQFKLYGHADVKLMDGGRKKWELDGRELVKDAPERPTTSYAAQAPDLSIRAFRDEVVASIGSKNLVDVRSPDEFSGKIKAPGAPAAGAVAASRSRADRHQHPVEQGRRRRRHLPLRRRAGRAVRRAGLPDGTPTIAYCRIGERSSHTWFVLHELLGKGDVKNYDGSWAEYGSLVGAPIAKDV
jgi:thiosulfate/3-mercaptopyruvate sulfurtransferase